MEQRTCIDCGKPVDRRSRRCLPCHVTARVVDPEQRFMRHVEKSDECWLWRGAKHGFGYGQFHGSQGKMVDAHRFAYEMFVGPIPEGLTIDHLCRIRNCVNPAHLEPVTLRENILRGENANKSKTHCKRGHPFDSRNTYWRQGERSCRTCRAARSRAYRKLIRYIGELPEVKR